MEVDYKITLNDVSLKAKSKKEIYLVLTVEGGLYLPPILDANRKYLRALMIGKKKFLYSSKIKVTKVPQVENLAIKNILEFAAKNVDIQNYLPEYEYNKQPNRDWLGNVINTLINEKFQNFISEKLNERKIALVSKRGFVLDAIPEIVDIFAKSKNVSYTKGKTHFLLRQSVTHKKRTAKNVEEEKQELYTNEIKKLNETVDKLEEKLKNTIQLNSDLLWHKEKLAKLLDEGVVDEHGEYIDKS